ncbi:YchJ family protein [Acidipropionibacterium timonense]|uniref:YchJ family protein n=1 Tax=Acidipropionibacterium timonense TaxID=2161818 RepID=UPI001031FC45|nr:YchJ family metal-binding protein [Acidipropionibacterium timonense]
MSSPCPCGSGAALSACCGPVLDDPRRALTAEALMRSRYSAHVLRRWNHLWATWHPRTRPDVVDEVPLRWTGLRVVRTEAGQPGDATGVVEYLAEHIGGRMHEVARFQFRAGRWMYVDGDLLD